MEIGGDAVYETPEFPGTLVAKAHAGRWLLWLRLTARAPAAGGSGGVDLGDLSLFCRFVDYPTTPAGPDRLHVWASRYEAQAASRKPAQLSLEPGSSQ